MMMKEIYRQKNPMNLLLNAYEVIILRIALKCHVTLQVQTRLRWRSCLASTTSMAVAYQMHRCICSALFISFSKIWFSCGNWCSSSLYCKRARPRLTPIVIHPTCMHSGVLDVTAEPRAASHFFKRAMQKWIAIATRELTIRLWEGTRVAQQPPNERHKSEGEHARTRHCL